MRVALSDKEVSYIKQQAVDRRLENLKAGNKNSNFGSATFRIEEEVLGIAGEFAVARAMGLDPYAIKFVIKQEEFKKVKREIRDVGSFEVKAFFDTPARRSIIVPVKNVAIYNGVPHIGCLVATDFSWVDLVGYCLPEDHEPLRLRPECFRANCPQAYFFNIRKHLRPITDLIK